MPEAIPEIHIGQQLVSNANPGLLLAVDDMTITWGRAGAFEHVEASTLKFTVYLAASRGTLDEMMKQNKLIGSTVTVKTTYLLTTLKLFTGRITEARVSLRPNRYWKISIIAVDILRDLGITLTGRNNITEFASTRLSIILPRISEHLSSIGLAGFREIRPADYRRSRSVNVFLGDAADQTWLDYIRELFAADLKQSMYFNPMSDAIEETTIPAAYGRIQNESVGLGYRKKFVADINRNNAVKIDPDLVGGSSDLVFSARTFIGTIEEEYYNRNWKKDRTQWVASQDWKTRRMTALRWSHRGLGESGFTVPTMISYLKSVENAPEPPTLIYQSKGNEIHNPWIWLATTERAYHDLTDVETVGWAWNTGILPTPIAKALSGEIVYNGKKGWRIKQNLTWCMHANP